MDSFERLHLKEENENGTDEHPFYTAIVLAAGRGIRMHYDVKK